jgi:cobalt-zinc-cadmium efflux system outer membrane protein
MPPQGSAEEPSAKSGNTSLSFDQAWQQALSQNPVLSAAQSRIDAEEGAAQQAGTRPNPELSLEAENFAGSGPNSGWDSAETTLLLSQAVETGGKRRNRAALAQAEKELSLAEREACRLDLWKSLVEHYVEALEAAELEAIAGDTVRLSGERLLLVSQRVQAGKVPPQEASRAEVEAALAGIEQEKARRQTHLSHLRLAALLGKKQPDFTLLWGRLEPARDWTPAGTTAADQPVPDLVKAEKELAARQAALKQAESLARPDVVLSAGLRRFEENGDFAFVAGITLPLPLFDRNRGGIQKARHELSRSTHLQQAALLDQHLGRAELLAAKDSAWNEIVVLRDKALPAALDALEKARKGYEQGKFSYLEWVDAEHSLVSLRTRWITTLTLYHKTLAAIGRLTGNTEGLVLFNQP